MDWPDDFLWGSGASSTQCEGASPHSNWWDWEQEGHAPPSGDGNGFATRYAQDFALLADLGLTHHRLSIEWARLEPEEGVHDQEAIAHYRRVLTAAIDAGVDPWVCLFHFTLPRWVSDRGGFLDPATRTGAWARHVAFVADTFGDLVKGWKPVNETNYYPAAAYLGRGFAPGRNSWDEMIVVAEELQLATAEAAVRLRETGAPVCSVFGLTGVARLDDEAATVGLADTFEDLHWKAGLGLCRDGVLRQPGRAPIERPDLAGCFDLLGFSFYTTMGFQQGEMVPYPADAPRSPLGYGIWADGLGDVLDRVHAEGPGVPIVVAEYGLGTDDDEQRAAYLQRGLEVTHAAIQRGVDVRGFFHWTAVDNYEWLHGHDVDFGIMDRDRNVRPSAQVLAAQARPR